MMNMKVFFIGFFAGFCCVHHSLAACSGEYNKSCGTNCCYKSDGSKAIIKEGSTDIGGYAFSGASLEDIVIPSSVTEIGNFAFAYNSNLKGVEIQGNNVQLGSNLFYLSSPQTTNFNTVTYSCGSNCTASLDSNGKVTYNGEGVFNEQGSYNPVIAPSGFGTINEVVFGDGFTGIGANTFQRNTSVTKVTIPDSVTSIGAAAFASSVLENIVIPSSVTEIGDRAFAYNDHLKSIILEGDNVHIGSNPLYITNAAIVYCSEAALSQSNNACSNNFPTSRIGKFSIDEEYTTSFFNPDGKNGFRLAKKMMADGTTDYYDNTGKRTRRVDAKGDEFTFEYDKVYCYVKDKNGKVIEKFYADGTPIRRIYTVQEAYDALGTSGKNRFLVQYR